jgi:hypothetical protein
MLATSKNAMKAMKHKAMKAWKNALPNLSSVNHLRAHAFCLKAICTMYKKYPSSELLQRVKRHSDILVSSYFAHRSGAWQWFENNLAYANGILPEALLEAYKICNESIYKKVAISTLNFLIRKTFSGGIYIAIGQRSWLKKGGTRGLFDQQPEDPYATLETLVRAFELTSKVKYAKLAEKCFSWFLGNNITGTSLYDFRDGGVFDGVTLVGVNRNKGAESLVSYLLSRNLIEELIRNEIYQNKTTFCHIRSAAI